MFENKTSVLLILSSDVLDRARVLAGKAAAALKLPVSLQIVLRALIGEGLKRDPRILSLPVWRRKGSQMPRIRRPTGRACEGVDSEENVSARWKENLAGRGRD